MLRHALTTIVWISNLSESRGTSSPAWEADMELLRQSTNVGLPFAPSKRRKTQMPIRGSNEDTAFSNAVVEVPGAFQNSSSSSQETFYDSLVREVGRGDGRFNSRRISYRKPKRSAHVMDFQLDWPLTIPDTFSPWYIDVVKFDRANGRLAPNLLSASLTESVPNFGPLVLNESIISATETAVVFRIQGGENVLKYQCDCYQEIIGDVHPVLLDWWFLKFLEPLGISPKAYYVSPPSSVVGVDRALSIKMSRLRMEEGDWRLCQTHPAGTVRFLVMENAGESLHRTMTASPNQRINLKRVVKLGISSLMAIRRLHEEVGVVHGDIHSGNICVRSDDSNHILLIDYGKAFFVKDMPKDEQIRKPFSWAHALFSPWNILGKRPGKRDDVFKILLTMAIVLNGPQFIEYLTRIENNKTLSFEWKQDRNFFVTQFFDFRREIRNAAGDRIVQIFGEILQSVREIASASHRPPYESIIRRLNTIESLLSVGPETSGSYESSRTSPESVDNVEAYSGVD